MCCEQLACAACGGPVADARCTTCAASRAHLHSGPGAGLSAELLLLLLTLSAVVWLLLSAR